MEDQYARVFVDAHDSLDGLASAIATGSLGIVDQDTVLTKTLEVDVRRNDEAKPSQALTGPKDFLFYQYTLDVRPRSPGLPLNQFIHALADLMRVLGAKGMRVVVACDWEDQLPGHGRID